MFAATAIPTLLAAVDAGLIVAEKFVELVETMNRENRDLTDDELQALDLERDMTHDRIQDAVRRKREREGQGD